MNMLRLGIRHASAAAALVFLLAACAAPTSGGSAGSSPSPAVTRAPIELQTPTPTATPTPTPGAYSAQQIATALTEINSQEGLNGQILDRDQILQVLPRTQQLMKQLDVVPASCADVFHLDLSKAVSEANMGMVVSTQPGTVNSLSLGALSFRSLAAMKSALNFDPAAVAQCSEMTVTVSGIAVHASARPLAVTVPGSTAYGSAAVLDASGLSQHTVTIVAVKGSTEVVATYSAPDADSAASVKRVEDLLGSTLAAVEAQTAPV
ncbi:hypothetical protein [Sinomonas terrae]|uniref:DUF5642 domain-containing protein n=1 Tax=Sinomonas terrae TaxID=2908838 RepID=A0ABS9U2M7_9MICC|nr:hypothetical protein [Sinomonas terrae]MCH6470947.1 hypothetical protein [Sinomonas terrae]